MLDEYDSIPPKHGKLKEFSTRYNVDHGFIRKARLTFEKLEKLTNENKLVTRANGPAIEISASRKTISCGQKVAYPLEEDWLYAMFSLHVAHEIPMSVTLLASLVVAKFPHLGQIKEENLTQWIYRWEKRYGVTVRRVTHSHDQDEQNIGEVRVDFVNYYHSIVADFSLKMDMIFNMDETAVDLSESLTTTLSTRGRKHISIQIPSNLPPRVSVLLAISYSGQFLPPLIVFKAKPGGRVEKEFTKPELNYSSNCFYTVQENAWCDQRVMDLWIAKIFNPYVIEKRPNDTDNSLLLMDNFSVHCTLETSRNLLSSTRVLLLPANTTSKTQALDVGINQPFKAAIKKRFRAFLSAEFRGLLE